jgi:hypothetical protein
LHGPGALSLDRLLGRVFAPAGRAPESRPKHMSAPATSSSSAAASPARPWPHARAPAAAEHRVVLVSEESYTTFNPMLAEVVGAAVFPSTWSRRSADAAPASRFVMGRVHGVDAARRVLTATHLAGRQEIGTSTWCSPSAPAPTSTSCPAWPSTRCR